MTVSIHQPLYLPYFGLFQKIYESDVFVFLDDVQYSNDNWQDYNVIKTPQGITRIRIPVDGKFGDRICDIRTKDELGWKKKHLKTIEYNYKRAPHFHEVVGVVFPLIREEYQSLSELNEAVITGIVHRLHIKTRILRSSEICAEGKKEERVINICKQVGATTYLSGTGASVYQEKRDFERAGLKLRYITLKKPEYRQLWGSNADGLSFLDYLMNVGFVLPAEWRGGQE